MPAKKKSSVSKTPRKKGVSKITFTAETDKPLNLEKCCRSTTIKQHTCAGGFYFLGFLGAVIYYISTATGFWNGVWGFIKAIVWPAFLVFHLMQSLGV